MNIDNLRIFVETLNNLSDINIKNNQVNINSMGVSSCPAGLIGIVADYRHELKCLCSQDSLYFYGRWANTLAEFLGFVDRAGLKKWAKDNPEMWGNEDGCHMFISGKAFGQKTNVFPHSVIIEHWSGVLERVEELNNKGEI